MKKHSILSREYPYLLSAVILSALLYIAHLSPLGQWVFSYQDLSVYFNSRHFFGLDHKIDPRLKVYVFDDQTVTSLKETDLSAQRWAEMFKAIADKNPKTIITPHSFSVVENLHDPLGFTDSIKEIKSKIATGVWLTPKTISGLLPLSPEDYPSLSLKYHLNVSNPGEVSWKSHDDVQIYGPGPGVMNAFSFFGGSWTYSHTVPLATKIQDEFVLTHLALHAADTLSVSNDSSLIVNEIKVPLSKEGETLINYVDPVLFFDKTKSILDPVRRVMRGTAYDEEISSGDVVLILPHFSAGLLQFENTPFGYLPKGYVIASIVNSVLTGNWLKPQSYEWLYLALCLFFATIVGRAAKRSRVPVYLPILLMLVFSGSLFIFYAAGFSFPVTFGVIGAFLQGVLCFQIRRSRLSLRLEEPLRIARYLWGRNGTKAEEKKYRRFPDEPVKKIVSLLYVRLDKIENILDKLSGEPLFDEFRRIELEVTKIVHESGGIEVKTRDGRKLAYFSSEISSNEGSSSHAEKALLCSERLVRSFASLLEEKLNDGDFVCEIKLALDTCSVFAGNFGDFDHLVPAALGQSVEDLAELSKSAGQLKVLLTQNAKSLIDESHLKNIKDKKASLFGKKVDLFEYDPIPEQKALIKELKEKLS